MPLYTPNGQEIEPKSPKAEPFTVQHNTLDEASLIMAQIHEQGGGYISTQRVFSSTSLTGWTFVTLYLAEEELEIEVWT